MKINVEELSSLERKLSVEIPAERVNQTYQMIYQSIQKQYAQPGFRKGKVPLTVIKSKYQGKVDQDVVEHLIGPAYSKALKEHELEPVMNPNFVHEKVEENKEFSFTANFEVRPKIELKKVEGLEVKKPKIEITEKNIEDVLENLRKNKGIKVSLKEPRPAKNGDIAIIDFEGFIDGAPLQGGKADGHELELGSEQFIPGFEEGILGMSVGDEKEIELKFPEDYHAKDIAGKMVNFKVKLNDLQEQELPELNDEFAKLVGENSTLDELRASIKDTLTQQEEKEIKDLIKNQLLQSLVEANPLEVPKTLLMEQKKLLIEDSHKRMESQGVPHAEVHQHIQDNDSEFESSSAFIIKSSYLISEIADKQEFKTTPEEFNRFVSERALEIGLPAEQLMSYYNNPEARSRVDFQIMEDQVMKYLLNTAVFKEVSKEELAK